MAWLRLTLGLQLLLATGPAAAQGAPDPVAAARLDRTLRAIEARRVTQPGLAARDAREASRVLARTRGGLSGQELRAGRRLDAAAATPQGGAASALTPLLPQPADALPRSTGPSRSTLGADPLSVVDQLIDRARAAVAAGRPADAADDLQFAERQLVRSTAGPPEAVAARRTAIGALRAALTGPVDR